MKNLLEMIMVIGMVFTGVACGEQGKEEASDETVEANGGGVYSRGYSSSKDSTISLSFQGAQSSTSLALVAQSIPVKSPAGAAVGNLNLTKAQIVLDKIKIKMEPDTTTAALTEGEDTGDDSASSSDDAAQIEFEFPGPFLVDLLTNTVTPDPGQLELPAGNYKEIVLSMHKVEDADAAILGMTSADPMFGNSFLIEGSYAPVDGASVNVNMSYEFGEDFKIRGSKGVDISAATLNEMVIAFRLARWFEFDNAETNPDNVDFSTLASGDIAINKDSDDVAKAIREVIKENVKESADFGKDSDGDGELSNSEDAEDDSEEDDI